MLKIIKELLNDTPLLSWNITEGINLVTSTPMYAVIGMTLIGREEVRAFHGKLSIGHTSIDSIPFLIFNFDDALFFDSSVFNIDTYEETSLSLYIILEELSNESIVCGREVELCKRFVELLNRGTKAISFNKEEFKQRVDCIQKKYNSKELFEMCIEVQEHEPFRSLETKNCFI